MGPRFQIKSTSSVRNLGLVIDDHLSLKKHVTSVVQSCNHKMRQFGRLRPYLTYEAAKTVAVALILSKLDYCNSCLWGIDETQIQRLQVVQNTAARIVSRTRKRDHITPVLRDLHWLRVKQRIDYKVLSLSYQSFDKTAPSYLCNLVMEHQLATDLVLRSSGQSRLHVPMKGANHKNVRHGRRSFSFAAPKLWNELPVGIRRAGSVTAFKRQLKTHLF